MKQIRALGVFMALVLIMTSLTSVQSTASANTSTSSQVISQPDFVANEITAHEDGSFTATACEYHDLNAVRGVHFDSQGDAKSVLAQSSPHMHCMNGSANVLSDGTTFMYRETPGWNSDIVAWKNGRQLWSTNTSSPTNCLYYGSGNSKTMIPRSIGEGPDGNIYAVFTSNLFPQNCENRIMGFERATGAVILDVPIGTPSIGTPSVSNYRAWIYDDEIIVIDATATIRYFDISSGIEDVGSRHTIPVANGHSISHLTADGERTVYGMTSSYLTSTPNPILYYHTRIGGSSSISSNYASHSVNSILEIGNGKIATIPGSGNVVEHMDTNIGTVTSVNVPINSGGSLIGYAEDTNGVQLIVEEYTQAGTSQRVLEVREYNSATSATNVLETIPIDGTTNYYPYRYYDNFASAIGGGYVYIQVCESAASVCAAWHTSPAQSIYKVSLEDFGTVIKNDFKRNTYESRKLEYVAMGDSFSSGEGVEPYLYGTAEEGINECHRSEHAYPLLLEQNSSLNLDLRSFVACSGAVTANIMVSSQWNEQNQIGALTENTDVVTITIGGNDVLFSEVLEKCVKAPSFDGWGCSQDTSLIDEIDNRMGALAGTSNITGVHSIFSVISAISAQSPSAQILVGGYPRLFGGDISDYTNNLEAPGGAACLIGIEGITISYSDAQWLNDMADELNQVISNAVTQSKIGGINAEFVPANFTNNGWCDRGVVYLNPVYIDSYTPIKSNPGSMHPNYQGQMEGYEFSFAIFIN